MSGQKMRLDTSGIDLKAGDRVFMTPAYIVVLERGTYGLYRDLVIEKSVSGTKVREKLKSIGPIGLFREREDGDDASSIALRTFHPTEGREISLVAIVG